VNILKANNIQYTHDKKRVNKRKGDILGVKKRNWVAKYGSKGDWNYRRTAYS
jgi:hypothetical protein